MTTKSGRRRRYDLVVVGLGSGGLPAVDFALEMGLRVVAVERHRVGGDCLWTGCVPSKALLASAKVAHHLRHADRWGLTPSEAAIDTAGVLARVRAVQDQIGAGDDSPERLRQAGLELVEGEARLVGPRTVAVAGRELSGRFVLLATGSRPLVPPLEGLEESGYLTSDSIFGLERLPASVVVIGGGPIAVELSQALVRLGVEVTMVELLPSILNREEPGLVERLRAVLVAEGVEVVEGARAERVEVVDGTKVVHGRQGDQPRTWAAEEVLVAVGRRPNVEALGTEAVGVETTKKGITTDERMRTSVASIYAVGDVAGRYLFTHTATHEGLRAVRDMFFPGKGKVSEQTPWATFTDPELARVGLTEAEARQSLDGVEVFEAELDHSDRARADGSTEGVLRVVTAKGRIVGVHLLAPAAGEMVAELALAMATGVPLARLARVIHVYPTLSSSVAQLAAEATFASARRYRWMTRVPWLARAVG